MNYSKIITHAGHHHADEVLAIATVFKFYKQLPIERKYNISKDELEDSEILILDIGREYDKSKGNFDHHQNGDVPATNLLILHHFCKDIELKNLLIKYLYGYVDASDRGLIHFDSNNDFHTPTFSSIINAFNHLTIGFEQALDFAMQVLDAEIEMAKDSLKSKEVWLTLEKQNHIVIQHDSRRITGWHELAQNDNILLYIFPCDRNENFYRLMVRDTRILTIPPHEKQSFLHANGFTAAYVDFESAWQHANEIIFNLNVRQSTEPWNVKP